MIKEDTGLTPEKKESLKQFRLGIIRGSHMGATTNLLREYNSQKASRIDLVALETVLKFRIAWFYWVLTGRLAKKREKMK